MTAPTNLLRASLEALLTSLFDDKSLRHHLHLGLDGEAVIELLPQNVNMRELVHTTVDILIRRGLVDAALFDRLGREFPARAKEIKVVQAQAIGSRPLGHDCPPITAGADNEPSHLEALELAYRQREECIVRGEDTASVDSAILELRRMEYRGRQLHAGQSLLSGRYRLVDTLGSGGFATVWRAYDRETRQLVALKVLHGQWVADRSYRERFTRGARKMMRLGHPHIVRVLREPCEDDSHLFYVMELIDGPSLHHAVLTQNLATTVSVRAILDVCGALSFAHAQGYVHRDVKPTNILIDRSMRGHLSDFDLIRGTDTTGGTRTGAGLGSMFYAAPESLYEANQVDARADVYSVGMTLLFVILGRNLNFDDFIATQGTGLSLSLAIAPLIYKATTRQLEERYSSILELKKDLESALAVWPWEPPPTGSILFKRKRLPLGPLEMVQKPVTGELLDRDHSPESPFTLRQERLTVGVTKKLAFDLVESPFYQRVQFPQHTNIPGQISYVSLFHVVQTFGTVLSERDLGDEHNNDQASATLATLVSRAFSLVKHAWPLAWAQTPRRSILVRNVGLRSVSLVLAKEIRIMHEGGLGLDSEQLWSSITSKVEYLKSRIIWCDDELASAGVFEKRWFLENISDLQSTARDMARLRSTLQHMLVDAQRAMDRKPK